MFYIVETQWQLQNLPQTDECFIELIAQCDDYHPNLTNPSLVYYNDFNKGYIIPITHSEGFSIDLGNVYKFLSRKAKVYVLDAKWHSYFLASHNLVDVYTTVLDETNKLEEDDCNTRLHNDYNNKFKYESNRNTLIPISKHYERCQCLYDSIKPFIGLEENLPWKNDYYEAYKWVERRGIKIDEKIFDKYFEPVWKARSVKNGLIYTSYNLYNVTGRPTNAFNGINFLAFNKDNNSRAAFVPYGDFFVEFDFDAYHLRLLGNHLGVELPQDESIHKILGCHYFGVDELTEEQYKESKKITFRQLYNGVEEAYREIELFKRISQFVLELDNHYTKHGYIILPNGRKLLKGDYNPQKLLNYYVQCLETVNNVQKLLRLRDYLSNKLSGVVLVVYDSILIDFHKQDGIETIKGILAILQEGGYTVKVQKGTNYNFYN